jgi:hypothetical protein
MENYKSYAHIYKLIKVDEDHVGAVQAMLAEPEFLTAYQGCVAKGLAPKEVKTLDQLIQIEQIFLQWLLANDQFESAATLLWSEHEFTTEPRQVKLIWRNIRKENRLFLMGAGGMSKTFTACIYCLLDWAADPEWTKVVIMSTNYEHARSNAFGDIVRKYQDAAIPLPGRVIDSWIGVDRKTGMGIQLLAVPPGAQSKGRIKGMRPKRRPVPHPKFGVLARTRWLFDEAEDMPANIWEDIGNIQTSISEKNPHAIKIFCAFNPKNPTSAVGVKAAPPGGYSKIGPTDEEWVAASGWKVVRLNGTLHENWIEGQAAVAAGRKPPERFPGFATYTGMQNTIKSHGADSPVVWSQVYGMYPPEGALNAIIRKATIEENIGTWIFAGPTVKFAGIDPATTGDRPAIAFGRMGYAYGWKDADGKEHKFGSTTITRHNPAAGIPVKANRQITKLVACIDTVFAMQNGRARDIVDQCLKHLTAQGVEPGHVCVDRTGVGDGIHDRLCELFGEEVIGINFSERATNIKVLAESRALPADTYDGIKTEVWYAAAAWLEAGVLKLDKLIDPEVIEELSSRQARIGKGVKIGIESKSDYKIRTGRKSPDLADAALVCLHAMRVGYPEIPGTFSEVTIDQLQQWTATPKVPRVLQPPIQFKPPVVSVEWRADEWDASQESTPIAPAHEWWENY